jgi:hypothetical protein
MTDVLGAIKHLGKCLREGKEIYMGVPAENVCIAAADEIERLLAARKAEREMIANKAREWAAHYPEASDGRNTFVLFAEWVERGGNEQSRD